MTTFLESPRFPDNIAFGATVGPCYLTVVNQVYSGRDARIVAWTQARVMFEVGRRVMFASDTAAIDAFFRTVKGRAYGFRIKDWTDFSDNGAGILTPVTGVGVYQMCKQYNNGALSETRLIQKPVVGTVVPYRNGTAVGTAYAVDTTTGLVTLGPVVSEAASAVSVGATTQITLVAPVPGAIVGSQLYLQGFTGTNAATLNGLTFPITAIAGDVYTVAANTTGLSITAGGSALAGLLPASGDVLTWRGQFDVPVRFDIDQMKKQIMDRNGPNGDLLVNWDSIPIIEVRVP